MTVNITTESVLASFDKALAQKGEDFVYPTHIIDQFGTCRYVYDGEPSCIVGFVLADHGVPLTQLSIWEGNDSQGLIEGLEYSLDITVSDPGAKTLLAIAQSVQDTDVRDYAERDEELPNNTWGNAVAEAKRIHAIRH